MKSVSFFVCLFVSSYFIDYENTDPFKIFAIDPDSGAVTVRGQIDREQTDAYSLTILAIDRGMSPMTTGILMP